ncbi:maleylpyruvate isomerase [Rhodococcus hoagii]|nr:maleylpyruvate isomerase [Prescottella equi]
MTFNDLDLAERLDIAREAHAYFAQKLAELSDEEMSGPSLLDGWTRKHLVGHVGYNAAALCRSSTGRPPGGDTDVRVGGASGTRDRRGRNAQRRVVSKLSSRAALNSTRSGARSRTPPWTAEVRTAQGRTVPASETAWMRKPRGVDPRGRPRQRWTVRGLPGRGARLASRRHRRHGRRKARVRVGARGGDRRFVVVEDGPPVPTWSRDRLPPWCAGRRAAARAASPPAANCSRRAGSEAPEPAGCPDFDRHFRVDIDSNMSSN